MHASSAPVKIATQLSFGEQGVIDHLSHSPISLKLLEMGCLPGKSIRVLRAAPLGSPLYMEVGSQCLALREEEAADIFVMVQP
jgi:ferrous iron transport protein A